MKDVEKTNIKRTNSGKRTRRRRRMMSIYAIVVVMLVLSIGVAACFTFLFNVDNIVVSGESLTYEARDIVEASELKAGDNLIRLNKKRAEKKILDKLLYVESAEIDKDFPSTLRITVTRCIPAYNIKYDSGVLLVSRKGKVLENTQMFTDVENLPVIYGLEPDSMEQGMQISAPNVRKFDAFSQIIGRFDRDSNEQIASIDLTNEYDIVVNYRNGVVFKMGSWNDVEYKLDLAQHVMEDEDIRGKSGTLVMVGSNQCSFRANKNDAPNGNSPIFVEQPPQIPTIDGNQA